MGYVKRPSLSNVPPKRVQEEKKKSLGSGEQSIEIPNSERRKSERMKELRKRQREAIVSEGTISEDEMVKNSDETRGEY